jgi:hypothetical protein
VAVETHLVGGPAGLPSVEQRSLTPVSPAAASSVGNQSRPENISFQTVPGRMWPGHRTNAGTRKAPSQLKFFSMSPRDIRTGVAAGCARAANDHAPAAPSRDTPADPIRCYPYRLGAQRLSPEQPRARQGADIPRPA